MPGRRLLLLLHAAFKSLRLQHPSFARQNTAATNAGDADMLPWQTVPAAITDKYGKLIQLDRWLNTGSSTKFHRPVVSNDGGTTWTEPTLSGFAAPGNNTDGEGVLVHYAHDYDAVNDVWHVVYVLDQTDGAVIHRQYEFTRDPTTHDITTVTRTRSIQLEVGVGGLGYESPICLWIPEGGTYGTVVCGWTVNSLTKSEGRLTMRRVSHDAGDATLANWLAPFNEASGVGATDSMGSTGLPKYSCFCKGAGTGQPFAGVLRKSTGAASHAKDLYILFSLRGGTFYANRAVWNAANNDWRGGLAGGTSGGVVVADSGLLTLTGIQRSGTDVGYALKYQLPCQPVEDTANDRVYFCVPTWKSDALGDTITVCYVDAADARSALVDVYSAGGAHSYAPTATIRWHAGQKRLVVAYIKTATQFAYVQTIAGTAIDQGETALFTAAPIDIPYLLPQDVGGKIGVCCRDTTVRTNPNRFFGYFGTIGWS